MSEKELKLMKGARVAAYISVGITVLGFLGIFNFNDDLEKAVVVIGSLIMIVIGFLGLNLSLIILNLLRTKQRVDEEFTE